MPGKTDLSLFNCSLARALSVVGDGWTLLLLRDAFLGLSRFGEFQASLGIARNILSERLGRLCEAGMLERRGSDTRPRYVLTDKGRALFPALIALQQWGDAWSAPNGVPVVVADARGRVIRPVRVESQDGRTLDAADVQFSPGPGANPRTRRQFTLLAARRAKRPPAKPR